MFDAATLAVIRPALAIGLIGLGLAAVVVVDHQLYPAWLNAGRRRALFHGLLLAGWIYAAYHLLTIVAGGHLADDARYYWAVNLGAPYVGRYGDQYAVTLFPYSPAAALVASAFALLPWPVFALAWTALLAGVAVWLGGRSFPLWLAFPPLIWLILIGNIELLMAAAVVLGFRWPYLWSVVLLTKVTPGIGLLWFAMRREWLALAKVAILTVTIVGITFVLLPRQWADWVGFLLSGRDEANGWLPLALRLPAAALLVIWGARTDRRWTVLLAVLLAVPHFWFATAGGLVALSRPQLRRFSPTTPRAPASCSSALWSRWARRRGRGRTAG